MTLTILTSCQSAFGRNSIPSFCFKQKTAYDIDILSVGIRQESTPDGVFDGVVRDLVLYDEDGTTPLWSVNGYGNTDADWEDQVGSNDGTVAGSPSRAVSTDGGATWAEET